MTLAGGSRLAHYRIVEKLGEGGMGEVYRAADTKLGREVALKVLPAEVAADRDRIDRFRREAQALAALDHPGIVTVYSVEEAEGVHFLTMQLVEGDSLDRLIPEGGLPEERLIAIGREIAAALEAAHDKGIVHRDLKPANVIVMPDGRVKILDFGLAKRSSASTAGVDEAMTTLAMTRAGLVLGTIPYMSPEQASGQPVDSRTDVFSFGVMLYEMATGLRPFREEEPSRLLASILMRDPQPPHELNHAVSPGLESTILKALEKKPDSRFQSLAEILEALDRIEIHGSIRRWPSHLLTRRGLLMTGGAALLAALAVVVSLTLGGLRQRLFGPSGAPRIHSLAVLPLENLTPGSNEDYFVDGMTEELTTDLAKISALRVISRSSMMRYKGSKEPVPQIAKEVKVDAVVEGSVMREGDRVRITAQLVDARTGRDLWANSYERDLSSILSLQSDIAGAVASSVRVTLTPAERSRLANGRPVDPVAYDDYLKGKHFLDKMTPDGFKKGLEYMQKAIHKDPTSPLFYAGLALGYARIGHERNVKEFAKAKAAAQKAEQLGGATAEMYLALGTVEFYSDWDFAAAGKDLRRAVELNPSLAEAHRHYSWYLDMRGKQDEAIAEMRRALQVNPLAPLYYADLGWQYWLAGRDDDAITAAHQSLELQANFNQALAVLGYAYLDKGEFKKAIASDEKLAATDPAWKWLLPYVYARAGETAKARETLAADLNGTPKPTGSWAGWFLAEAYGALGDMDQAFHWLNAAYQERHSFVPFVRVDRGMASLRSDPRYKAFVARMHYQPD